MKKLDLTLCYKGTRPYIQGGDMMAKSIELLNEQFPQEFTNLDFIIHRMTGRNLALYLYTQENAPELIEQDIAAIKFETGGKSWEARLKERDSIPDCRYSYDEDAVTSLCAINNEERTIHFLAEELYSAIDTLVTMTKALHHDLYPELDVRWMFCRWESPHWPLGTGMKGVCVRLVQALGTRLTKSEVSLHGQILGYIYFSARDKE